MLHDQTLRLRLTPAPDDQRIVGRLQVEDGTEHQFSSWLGLLSLLDQARARAKDDLDAHD